MIDFPTYIKPLCFPTMKLYEEWKDCETAAKKFKLIANELEPANLDILKIHKAIYDFIIWYNNQK